MGGFAAGLLPLSAGLPALHHACSFWPTFWTQSLLTGAPASPHPAPPHRIPVHLPPWHETTRPQLPPYGESNQLPSAPQLERPPAHLPHSCVPCERHATDAPGTSQLARFVSCRSRCHENEILYCRVVTGLADGTADILWHKGLLQAYPIPVVVVVVVAVVVLR